MLEAVRAMCAQEQVPAQLALEAPMACGFGACFGCAVGRRSGGYLRVCVDGPVIDAESSEMHVLRGAERTIDRFHPRIIVEVGDFDLAGVASSSELVRSLLALGYRAYERSQCDVRLHEPRATYGYGNLLFVHHEMPGAC